MAAGVEDSPEVQTTCPNSQLDVNHVLNETQQPGCRNVVTTASETFHPGVSGVDFVGGHGDYLHPEVVTVQPTLVEHGNYLQNLTVGGKERQFEVHVPQGYDGKTPVPVFYVMHGFGGNMAQMAGETNLDHYADQKTPNAPHGFAVVYLQALTKPDVILNQGATSWNLKHGSLTNYDPSYNDLDYIKEVHNQVGHEFKIDPAKQYIAGFSEGGGAAQYVAEKMPHTFAGIGVIHGTHLESDPKPQTGDPTSVVVIHGNDDNMLPISGGHGWFETRGQGIIGISPLKGFMSITLGKVGQSEPLAQAPLWAKADQCGKPTTTNNGYDKITSYTCPSGEKVTQIIHEGDGPQIFTVPFNAIGHLFGAVSYGKLQHAETGGQHAIDDGEDISGNNANGKPAGMPDHGHGWHVVGNPDPTENDTRTIVDDLLPIRKPSE